jgi:hypothetical protein
MLGKLMVARGMRISTYHAGFNSPLGVVGAICELPDFKKDAQVAYCPKGTTHVCGKSRRRGSTMRDARAPAHTG